MELKEVMNEKTFVIVGDTLNESKFAYKIKHAMLDKKYEVFSVGKELSSINDVPADIDVIDLCINPIKGLALMKECNKKFKSIVIQPGAGSKELEDFLISKGYSFIHSCLLIGLREYR